MNNNISFQHIDLSVIWDPLITKHPKFREAVDLAVGDGCDFDDRHSWLVQMIFQDRYAANEDVDELLYQKYKNYNRGHYSWYLALQHCDRYSYIIGVFLQLKYPDKEWVIVYVPDHYFCIEKQDKYEGQVGIYDLFNHCNIETGIKNAKTAWSALEKRWYERHVIRSVDEHGIFIQNGGYDY